MSKHSLQDFFFKEFLCRWLVECQCHLQPKVKSKFDFEKKKNFPIGTINRKRVRLSSLYIPILLLSPFYKLIILLSPLYILNRHHRMPRGIVHAPQRSSSSEKNTHEDLAVGTESLPLSGRGWGSTRTKSFLSAVGCPFPHSPSLSLTLSRSVFTSPPSPYSSFELHESLEPRAMTHENGVDVPDSRRHCLSLGLFGGINITE